MKLSTKVRYGMRFLLDLGLHEHEGNIKLKDVAQRQNISEKYLWQVINPLKTAGLIRAAAGPGGGYQLARPMMAITVHDVLAILDGDHGLIDCTSGTDLCSKVETCAARLAWAEIELALDRATKAITLNALVVKQRLLNTGQTDAYVI